ncbi:MAG: hypothetical protein BGO67_00535 [Alphaproteobacteria bacterium 41-28]|nr:MAG: hypothetical protein BGO67_00535 [Alphaproteobacteria bacterium 41-28]
MYAEGKGVKKSHIKAVKWIKRAASRGNVQAQLILELVYAHDRPAEESYIKVVEWLDNAVLGRVPKDRFEGSE